MHFLCQRDDIPDPGAKGFVVDQQPLFAVHRYGDIFVYRNACPHLGIELEWMPDQFLDRDGELIQCATHGALFLIDTGACVAGPCTGQALEPLPFTVQDGAIYLLSPAAAAKD